VRVTKFHVIDLRFGATNIKNCEESAKQAFLLSMANPAACKSNIAILNVADIINMIVKIFL